MPKERIMSAPKVGETLALPRPSVKGFRHKSGRGGLPQQVFVVKLL